MKNKHLVATLCLMMTFCSPVAVFARPVDTLSVSDDKAEILALEDDLLEKINYGAARSEIDSNELINSIDFNTAYKVYGNSKLFEAKSSDCELLLGILNDGGYIWQIPFFIESNTILVDIVKVAEIPNKWTIGATYVYNGRIVDYNDNIIHSLENSGLNPDDYTYAFVSGLPQIRYPVAIVFDDKARFVIPAEESATHAFKNVNEDIAYVSEETLSNSNRDNYRAGFTVYDFDKVAYVINSTVPGIGGEGIGIGKGIKKYQIYIGIIVCMGCTGAGIWHKIRLSKK